MAPGFWDKGDRGRTGDDVRALWQRIERIKTRQTLRPSDTWHGLRISLIMEISDQLDNCEDRQGELTGTESRYENR